MKHFNDYFINIGLGLNSETLNYRNISYENLNKISFLGILIKNKGENFSTTIFRKATAIGLFTNYLSFTPLPYKTGLVKTLIHCASKICSYWSLFHDEVNGIKKYLEKNSYRSILLIGKLTLFRMVFFGAAHGWRATKKAKVPMMKPGTVIPYPKKIQKIYESRDTPLEFC